MAKSRPLKLPYKPSWQNQFFDWGRLPVPKAAMMLLLFIGFSFINHFVPWIEGKLSWGVIDYYQFTFHIWFLVVFIAFDYFLSYANKAMDRFRPALDVSEKEFAAFKYEFINLPNRNGWSITFLAAMVVIASSVLSSAYVVAGYFKSGLSMIVFAITEIFMFGLVFALFANLLRQFIFITKLYNRVTRVNIFHLTPLYAFSGFTYRTGIFLILAGVLSYLTNVAFSQSSPQFGSFLFFSSLNLAVALGAFLLPLGGIHTKLEAEKERISKENDERINRALALLHRKVDTNKSADMLSFRSSISALLDYREAISRISTWPWEPGTLRNFITALFVPLAVWAIQQFLTRLVGN